MGWKRRLITLKIFIIRTKKLREKEIFHLDKKLYRKIYDNLAENKKKKEKEKSIHISRSEEKFLSQSHLFS